MSNTATMKLWTDALDLKKARQELEKLEEQTDAGPALRASWAATAYQAFERVYVRNLEQAGAQPAESNRRQP